MTVEEEYNKNTLNQINELNKELLKIKSETDIPNSVIKDIQKRLDKLILKIKPNDKN